MTETFTAGSRGKSGIDLKELKKLTADLHKWNPDKALKKEMRKAAAPIVDEARVLIAGRSKSVPGTIRARTTRNGITLLAGGPGVPVAILQEIGNIKGRGKNRAATRRGLFRHPVYAKGPRSSWHWVDQKRESFLLPAAEAKAPQFEASVGDAYVAAFRESGFR
jgi:hypothetical protein